MSDEKTGFDIHVSSGLANKLWPLLVAGALGLTSGGGASTWFDVTGARDFKDRLAEKVSHVDELEDEVTALRAQNSQLLRLLDGATLCPEVE